MARLNDEDQEILAIGTSEEEFYKEMEKHEITSFEEIRQLIQEYHKGNISARNDIVKRNLRLLVAPAKKFAHRTQSLEFIDLIHEGLLRMMCSIETYDPEKGSFANYCIPMIENCLRNAVIGDSTIGETNYICKKDREYRDLIKNEKNLTDKEICEKLNITQETLYYLKVKPNIEFVSMNQEIGEDGSITLEDTISKEEEVSPYDKFLDEEEEKVLFAFLRYILLQKNTLFFILEF